MERHDFLAALHANLAPRNYLEIGVGTGLSLALSRVPSIALDPSFQVASEIRTDVQLARATSDCFFARQDPLRGLRGGRNPWRRVRLPASRVRARLRRELTPLVATAPLPMPSGGSRS